MNYLFFDIECGRCEKKGKGFICEFGFVVCDEEFNLLKKEHIMINPDCEFDKFALENILQYTKEEYESHPLFPRFYKKIKRVLVEEEPCVVGHTTSLDFGYIKSECERYNLLIIERDYFDIRIPFKVLQKQPHYSSLENMMQILGLETSGKMHNALTDAFATYLVCKELSKIHSLTLKELFMVREPVVKKKIKDKNRHSGSSIGERLKGQGIDLSKIKK